MIGPDMRMHVWLLVEMREPQETARQVCDGMSCGRCDRLPSHTDNNTLVDCFYILKHT